MGICVYSSPEDVAGFEFDVHWLLSLFELPFGIQNHVGFMLQAAAMILAIVAVGEWSEQFEQLINVAEQVNRLLAPVWEVCKKTTMLLLRSLFGQTPLQIAVHTNLTVEHDICFVYFLKVFRTLSLSLALRYDILRPTLTTSHWDQAK